MVDGGWPPRARRRAVLCSGDCCLSSCKKIWHGFRSKRMIMDFKSPPTQDNAARFVSEGDLTNGKSHLCRSPSRVLRSDAAAFLKASPRSPFAVQPPDAGGDSFENRRTSLVACRKIPGLCEPIVQRILETLEQFGLKGRWRIPEDARKMLEHQLDIGTHTLMQKLCIVAQTFAVPVISAFHVGAAVLGTSGDVFLGLNVEICSGSYSNNLCGLRQTIHAEQAAILCMFSQGEPGAEKLYCTHVPCGMCRQFLAELPNHEALNIWCPQIKDGITLAKLLPHSFGPADLGVSAGLLSRGDRNPIYLGSASEAREVDLALAMVAELAAQRSWAPYTKSYAGCALRLANGDHVHGSCIESAAFNPTMTPLQMALVTLFARGGGVHDIKDACLAEDSSALVSYKDADGSLLNAIAPGVSLWLLPLERRDDHVFSSGF